MEYEFYERFKELQDRVSTIETILSRMLEEPEEKNSKEKGVETEI